jgi:hypothetical protein
MLKIIFKKSDDGITTIMKMTVINMQNMKMMMTIMWLYVMMMIKNGGHDKKVDDFC